MTYQGKFSSLVFGDFAHVQLIHMYILGKRKNKKSNENETEIKNTE